MSISEQQETKEKYYSEAMRYMDNAKACLKNTEIKDNLYQDAKYVRMACGTAHSGILIALDCFFILKDAHTSESKRIRKSIEYYQRNLKKKDNKLLDVLNEAYKILHLSGYYDGIQTVNVIKEGFKYASVIIEKIKPTGYDSSAVERHLQCRSETSGNL